MSRCHADTQTPTPALGFLIFSPFFCLFHSLIIFPFLFIKNAKTNKFRERKKERERRVVMLLTCPYANDGLGPPTCCRSVSSASLSLSSHFLSLSHAVSSYTRLHTNVPSSPPRALALKNFYFHFLY